MAKSFQNLKSDDKASEAFSSIPMQGSCKKSYV